MKLITLPKAKYVINNDTDFKQDVEGSIQWFEDNNINYEDITSIDEDILEDTITKELFSKKETPESEGGLSSKDIPKMILEFSSKMLLKLLHKHLRTSVDGTFKSSCFLWSQHFRWSTKSSGY